MSKNCLLTKLKGSVSDSSLKKLGVLYLKATAIDAQYYVESVSRLTLGLSALTEDVVVKVGTGGACATTFAGLTNNPQTEITFAAAGQTENVSVYFSNATYDIEVSNRYELDRVACSWQSSSNPMLLSIPDISDLDYSPLITLYLNGEGTGGDISGLTTGVFKNLRLADTGIYGDISDLQFDAGNMTMMSWLNCNVWGDFTNALAACSEGLAAGGLQSVFKTSTEAGKTMTADFSQAASQTQSLISLSSGHDFSGVNIEGRWEGTRDSSSYILAFQRGTNAVVDFGEDLDAMLINQANCTVSPRTESYYKTIDVAGERTALSDAAVSTLKANGYTVKVNGTTL